MHVHRKFAFLVVFFTLVCLPAYAHHVAVVTQPANPAGAVTSAELGKILKSEIRKWPDGHEMLIVLNRNSAVSFEIMERLTGLPAAKAKAFAEEHKSSFLLADTDVEVLDLVAGRQGALGLVDVRSVDSRVKVLKVDGKLPLEKAYLPH